MDNSIFKSLTCGVKFKKHTLKREEPGVEKFEEIKVESDEDIVESPAKKRKKLSQEYLRQKHLEDTNRIRKQHQINVKGAVENVKPVESFQELFKRYPLHQELVENIKRFNYKQPTPVQMQVLPLFLEQIPMKVVAPTGSGETLRSSESDEFSNNFFIFRKDFSFRCSDHSKFDGGPHIVA